MISRLCAVAGLCLAACVGADVLPPESVAVSGADGGADGGADDVNWDGRPLLLGSPRDIDGTGVDGTGGATDPEPEPELDPEPEPDPEPELDPEPEPDPEPGLMPLGDLDQLVGVWAVIRTTRTYTVGECPGAAVGRQNEARWTCSPSGDGTVACDVEGSVYTPIVFRRGVGALRGSAAAPDDSGGDDVMTVSLVVDDGNGSLVAEETISTNDVCIIVRDIDGDRESRLTE